MADRGAVADSKYSMLTTSAKYLMTTGMWVNSVASGSKSPESKYAPNKSAYAINLETNFNINFWTNSSAASKGPNTPPKVNILFYNFQIYLAGTLDDISKYNSAGTFSGVITKHSIVQPNVRVFLLLRRTMTVIGSTWTDVNGRYTFTGYDTGPLNVNNYVIQVSDPELESYANLGRLDRMTAG